MKILTIIIGVVVAALDQIIKYFINSAHTSGNLNMGDNVVALPHILDITYYENNGIALGMFDGMRWIFIASTSIIICVLLYIVIFKNIQSKLFYISSALVIGGGIGNLIDRIFYGYVIDYLQLSFFSPVCNFADYAITIGTVLLMIYLLFVSDAINKKEKTNENS